MTRTLTVLRAGPGTSIQDQGRPGYLAYGVSRGGAADLVALSEGAVLLQQSPKCAAIEMAGLGGEFQASEDMRIALTGAEMTAKIDGQALRWNASHLLPKGAVLSIGATRAGSYGYLHLGGGLATEMRLGSRSAHLAAGLGGGLETGQVLPVGMDAGAVIGHGIRPIERMGAGTVRVVASLQTHLFKSVLQRFEKTEFTKDFRGNRMGVRMRSDGPGFALEGALSVLSEVISPGDIQITGDGSPFVLLSECQTTGGYPRIGTVLPCDLPRVAQARPGETLQFHFVSMADALEAERRHRAELAALPGGLFPLIRDPHDIGDLLSYQLISGMIAGTEKDAP
ncbi:MAG: biotin-dependent carboxyltransferase family protein [Thalassovita sp.]